MLLRLTGRSWRFWRFKVLVVEALAVQNPARSKSRSFKILEDWRKEQQQRNSLATQSRYGKQIQISCPRVGSDFAVEGCEQPKTQN
jgi:hypothetical protein